jgi:hypothetical protein
VLEEIAFLSGIKPAVLRFKEYLAEACVLSQFFAKASNIQ